MFLVSLSPIQERSEVTERPEPSWMPEYVDMKGLAHLLSTSTKQIQRMLSNGRLPAADVNISGTKGFKGRRWRRENVIAHLEATGL